MEQISTPTFSITLHLSSTVINGANLFWPQQFGINTKDPDATKADRDQWLLGIVASAPYVLLLTPILY